MSRSAVILRNVASNWVGFAVNAAVTLLLTPFVLRALGPGRYGIWVLTSSIIGYYGLLDLGFRAGVTQYLTRYLAVGDYRKASECMSSAIAVLGALGAAMLVISVGAAYAAPHVFTLPGGLEAEAFWCILIVGGSSAIQFALQPYTSVFTALQRFDLATAIGIVTRFMTAVGVVFALKMGWGLIGVSTATCAVSVADYLLRWRVARRLAPQIEVSRRSVSRQRINEISVFGVWNFLVSVNAFVYQHVPNILIGTVMPVAAVGYYALATGLTRQMNSVLGTVPQVLYPEAAALHVRGNRDGLERLYHDGSRLMQLVMIPTVLIAGSWAQDFYRLWIGEKYVNGGEFSSVALVFRILLISVFTNYSTSVASQILNGAGHVRTVAIAVICGSILNLTVSFILIHPYGLLGVAIATASASVVIDLIAMPVLLQKKVGLSVMGFVRHAAKRPVLLGILQLLVIVGVRSIGQPHTWFELATQGAVAGAAMAALIVAFGITPAERQRYVVRGFVRLSDKWKQAEESPS